MEAERRMPTRAVARPKTSVLRPWRYLERRLTRIEAYILYLLAQDMTEEQVYSMVMGVGGGCVMGPDGKPIEGANTMTLQTIRDLAKKETRAINHIAEAFIDDIEHSRAQAGVAMAMERMLHMLANPVMSEPERAGDVAKIMWSMNEQLARIKERATERQKRMAAGHDRNFIEATVRESDDEEAELAKELKGRET